MYLSPDIQHKLMALRTALVTVTREISVYEGGITEETTEFSAIMAYINSIYQAIDYIKSNNVTVSLEEYRKMRYELEKAREVVYKKQITVNNLRTVLASKRREVVAIESTIDLITNENKRGVVLPFRKRK